jgi:hypothetical protein
MAAAVQLASLAIWAGMFDLCDKDYLCALDVQKQVPETYFDGHGEGSDKESALDAAWAAACSKVPKADRLDCHKGTKTFEVGYTQTGTSHVAVNLRLTTKPPTWSATVETTTGMDEACARATVEACKQAGHHGDCTKAGAFKAVITRQRERLHQGP